MKLRYLILLIIVCTSSAFSATFQERFSSKVSVETKNSYLARSNSVSDFMKMDQNQMMVKEAGTVNASVFASFSACKATVAGSGKTIIVSTPVTVNTLTMTTPIRVISGGSINVSTGSIFTMYGNIEAGEYQIFSGSGAVRGLAKALPEWFGAKGDGLANDTAEIVNSAKALNAGGTLLLSRRYRLVNRYPVISSVNARIVGITKAAELFQSSGDTRALQIKANGVTVDSIKFSGTHKDKDPNPFDGTGAAIDCTGSSGNNRTAITINNCSFDTFVTAVYAPYNRNFVASHLNITGVKVGILGMASPVTQNTSGCSYLVTDSTIICTYGNLAYSRPIGLWYVNNYSIRKIYGRGGGMGFEAVMNSATMDPAHVSQADVIDCDFDTAISGCNGGTARGNLLDLANAPQGRGNQPGYSYALECVVSANIINNIVRNHVNGVSINSGKVDGNTFIRCGSGANEGNGAVIKYTQIKDGADDEVNLVISNNTFIDTQLPANKHDVIDIAIFGAGNGHYVYGFKIIDNTFINSAVYPVLLSNTHSWVITGNVFKDVCSANYTTVNAYAIKEVNGNPRWGGYIADNKFVNTLTNGNGIYQAFAVQPLTRIGFNEIIGARNTSNPISVPKSSQIITPQKVIKRFSGLPVPNK